MLKIFIVDDHEVIRNAVKKILNRIPSVEIIGETDNGVEAVHNVLLTQPDIVFLDIKMNDINGIEVTKQLIKKRFSGKIIILSQYDKEEYVRQAIEAGAIGYLLKESMTKDIVNAVEMCRSGLSFFSRSISKSLVEECVEVIAESHRP